MLRSSGVTATGLNWFRFKTTAYQDRITLEWPKETDVIVVSKDIVDFLQAHKYARPLTEDEIEGYNAAVDAAPEASEDPAATAVAKTAETAPTGQETGAPGGSNEPPPPPPNEPVVPPVETDGQQAADSSNKTPEQLAAEQMLASMSKTKKG